jgi:hypothetical protein
VNDFLHGAITLASLLVALFFLRYWRVTHDRLFIMFSAAFWLLAMHWLLISVLPSLQTQAHALRFLAFALIAVAVLDKNRQGEGKTP